MMTDTMMRWLWGTCFALWTGAVVLVTLLLSAPAPEPVRFDLGRVVIMDDATRPTVTCVMYIDEQDWC